MRLLPLCPLVLVSMCAPAQSVSQQPTADAIMARVAANQDRAEAERSHFVYNQHVRAISRKGKTVRCEETTDSRVTPSGTGSHQELLKLDGRLLVKGQYVNYTTLPDDKKKDSVNLDLNNDDFHASVKSEDDNGEMDRDLVENLRRNLLDTKSKDGMAAGLFPLTSKAAAHYNYRLLGREPRNGRDCFHIAFAPKDNDDYDWKGDAWIDATAYEPVVVRTALSKNIPIAVRLLLGTSLPGLGFTVTYAPQPTNLPADTTGALWFPSTFGTEFKLHVFFFINREIVLDAQNLDFEKTHVKSTILPSAPESSQQ